MASTIKCRAARSGADCKAFELVSALLVAFGLYPNAFNLTVPARRNPRCDEEIDPMPPNPATSSYLFHHVDCLFTMPKDIVPTSAKSTPYGKRAPRRPTLASQREANESQLEQVLSSLRRQANLGFPDRPSDMPGRFIKVALYRATGKVFGPHHAEFDDLGRMCFLSQEMAVNQKSLHKQANVRTVKATAVKTYKTFNPADIIPRQMLLNSQALLDCLALREALRSEPRKKKRNTQLTQALPGDVTSMGTSSTPQRRFNRPILDLPPLDDDDDDDDDNHSFDDFELLPNPSSDDLPVPDSDATMFGTSSDDGSYSKGKVVEDVVDIGADRLEVQEVDIDFRVVVFCWCQDDEPPKRITVSILRSDAGFICLRSIKLHLGKMGLEVGDAVQRYIATNDRWRPIQWTTPFHVDKGAAIGLKRAEVEVMDGWNDYKEHTFGV
ncbi:hypothetical protein PQX77_002826 [Marasmius sp. AFHP31]|nr:hypothetical protein PQX77_002826 [Marasmius sp. AFHP31]